MKKLIFLLAFVTAFHMALIAQVLKPVKWSFDQKASGANEIELLFKASIDPGWHLYSINLPEGGPIKTTFSFNLDSSLVQLDGGIVAMSNPVKEHDKIFNMDLEYFAREANRCSSMLFIDNAFLFSSF